jgi:hypothetical protein
VALLAAAGATVLLLARPTSDAGPERVQTAAAMLAPPTTQPWQALPRPEPPSEAVETPTAPPPTAAPTTAPPPTEPPTTTTAPAPPPTDPPAPEPDPTPEAEPEGTTAEATDNAVPATVAPDSSPHQAPGGGWEQLRQCESGGDYTVHQRGGPGRGAYQFDQPTWDGVVARLGRSDLVGVSPADAAPADQDQAALQLYDERGSQPWPYCGRYV